jgi:Na+-driven multidrug efflux pump
MKWRELWRGFLPLLLTFSVAQLVLQADLVMLSRLGEFATAACIALIRIALPDMVLTMAVGSVASVVVSQAHRDGCADAAVRQALAIAALLGVMVSLLGLLLYPHMATWLVGSDEVSKLVADAVFWYSLAAPFRLVSTAAVFILHALGEGKSVVLWKCIEVGLKVLFNWLLIFLLALGFNGSYKAGLIVSLLSCGWLLNRLHQQIAITFDLPDAVWVRDFLRKVGWEAQRLVSAQLFALLALVLFASPYFAPQELARLSAYSAGSALMFLLMAPLVALMRSLAFQLAGCTAAMMLSVLKMLCGVGLPVVVLLAVALYLGGDWLGQVLYGQQHSRWWSVLMLVLAVSLPLRFFNNLQRALLQARQEFAAVSQAESIFTWGIGLPLIIFGLYLDNPLLAYSHILLSELCSALWFWWCLLPLYRECHIDTRVAMDVQRSPRVV